MTADNWFARLLDDIGALIPTVISVILLIVAALIITKIVKRTFAKLPSRSSKITPMMAGLLTKVLNVIIWVIAMIIILQNFGIDLGPVIAGLGVSGLVLGFALQESVSSFFSGMLIAINNPFRIGDFVEINGTAGTVASMDLMCVVLTTGDNKRITLSNKSVWGSVIVNYSNIERRRVDIEIGVGYSSDLDKVRKCCQEILASYPEVLKDPAPVVEVKELGASSINFVVRPWVKPENYWAVYWKFHQDIVEKFRAEDIEIPFDQLDLHIVSDSTK